MRHTNTCNLDITDLFTNLFLTATAGVSNMERGNSRQIFAKCRSKSNSKKIIRDRAHELQICCEDRWQSLFLSLSRSKAVGSYHIREPSFTSFFFKLWKIFKIIRSPWKLYSEKNYFEPRLNNILAGTKTDNIKMGCFKCCIACISNCTLLMGHLQYVWWRILFQKSIRAEMEIF